MTRTPSRPPVLDVSGLQVSYGTDHVLTDVDLTLRSGEVCAIVGPSGSGKTTLLRALMGLVPVPGRVAARRLELATVDGVVDLAPPDPRRWQQARRAHIGVLFQDAALALTPLRRVGSLVAEVADLRGVPRDRGGRDRPPDPLLGALAWAGFDDPEAVLPRRAYELSGGMAQRVGLALAVAGPPPILLADEPTSALDGLARTEMMARLREFADRGGAVAVVTHDPTVACAVADRAVALSAGTLHEQPLADLPGPPARAARRATATRAPGAPRALEVRGLEKAYAGTGRVLTGVDLVVQRGEVVGLTGRSGVGKSTLVRCLVGLEPVDGGSLRIVGDGPEIGWRRLRRRIQLVPQDPRAALNPWRTARQLVADPLDAHRIGRPAWRRERADSLLEEVGLDGAGDARPAALSTGQCQRVAVARALAVEPGLVVADEPVASLDAALRDDVLALLRRIADERDVAVLLVSHDLTALESVCDRVAVLHGGAVVDDLVVDRLRTDARHPVTRALLDAHPAETDDSSMKELL